MKLSDNWAVITADLGYGDAGKGSLVDYLARITPAHTVIRYNGGAQAAHNVITPEGRHHTFAQFGSGMFMPGVKTHLSRFMLLHPLAMLAEERHLQSVGVRYAFARTTIDRQTLVITPFQQAANRIKEIARGAARHGSCGMGIGETASDRLEYGDRVLFAGDLENRETLQKKLAFIRDAKITQLEDTLRHMPKTGNIQTELKTLLDPAIINKTADLFHDFSGQVNLVDGSYLQKILREPGVAIFEGAQGVLLDEWYGFYPYNSWSTLTMHNADQLLSEAGFSGQIYKLGLLRGYATRHGAGPFITYDPYLTEHFPDFHNTRNPWQQDFRVGYLDLPVLQYALSVNGPIDGLAITNLDRMDSFPHWKICRAYGYGGSQPAANDYFHFEGNQVANIKVPPDPTNLSRQEALTRMLLEMEPVYTRYAKDRQAYIAQISSCLQVPAAVISSGPMTSDKTNLRLPFFRPRAFFQNDNSSRNRENLAVGSAIM